MVRPVFLVCKLPGSFIRSCIPLVQKHLLYSQYCLSIRILKHHSCFKEDFCIYDVQNIYWQLRWGPHIKKVQAKMAAQTMAFTKVTTSIWGATLNKARQVYTAVVWPTITYGAVVWYSPKRSRIKGPRSAAKLTTLQNKCLQLITKAYKTTNIQVLEAEAGVIPLNIHLDQAVLRVKNAERCKKVICQAKEKVHHKLRGKKERKSWSGDIPMRIKEAWAKNIMEKLLLWS